MLRKNFTLFFIRTIMQPLLLVFVFTYVFPKIGQGVGGGERAAPRSPPRSSPASSASPSCSRASRPSPCPLVQEFGYSKEIEDRVLAPLPTRLVGVQKIVTGMLQALIAAALVFPIAAIVPATPVHLAHRLARAAHAGAARRLGAPPPSGWCSARRLRRRTCRTCSPSSCCR